MSRLRGDRRSRRSNGKSDAIDAEAAARSVLAGTSTAIPKIADGLVEMIRHPKVARDTARKGRTTAVITVGAMTVNAPAELREIPRWAHQSGAHQPLRPLPGLGDEHPHSLVEALTESTSTPLASTSTPRCAPYDAVLDDLTAQASQTLRDGIWNRSRPGGGDPHRVQRQPRTDPLRSPIRETLRHLPHPRIIRTNQPASSPAEAGTAKPTRRYTE